MIKPPILTICSIAALCTASPLFAGTSSYGGESQTITTTVQSTTTSEIARRQESVTRAQSAIAEGDKAMAEKDYEKAVAQYKTAVDLLPESRQTHSLRRRALHSFCDASVSLAEQRITEGRYADAESTLKVVLSDQYDPNCVSALKVLSHLEAPDYYNKTITPGFRAKVEKVKQLLVEAKGFTETGRYRLAFKRYEQVLNIDPTNIAARKGEEQVDKKRYEYDKSAYNETRGRAMEEVESAWGRPVRKFTTGPSGPGGPSITETQGTEYIQKKLNRIIIPNIEFKDATVREAIDFLRQKTDQLDPETDPSKKGINFVLKVSPTNTGTTAPASAPGATTPASTTGGAGAAINPADARITLSLHNIPVGDALKYITQLAGLKVKVNPNAVLILPLNDNSGATLVTKVFRVPPSMFSGSASTLNANSANVLNAQPASPIASTNSNNTSSVTGPANAKQYFLAQGVQFPEGATAQYISASSRLVVRNDQSNMDLIEALVQQQNLVPTQVKIQAKFVEITQNNLKELGFSWLLGQSSVPGAGNVFYGGGTSGNTSTLNNQDYPFVNPGSQTPVGQFPITGGNRSGNLAITGNAIDALLFGSPGASQLAPAIFGLSGVFSDPQFQLVIRALNQKKGVDLLSAPEVTTKSGQQASVQVITEFIYPNSFTPPTIPTSTGTSYGGGGGGFLNPITGLLTGGGSDSGSFPVTPTTPASFTTRNTGVTLDVNPTVGPDGYTIDMQLQPQVVEFEGFINYGSPIQTSSTNPITGQTTTNVITPNVINQPIFSTRKITTSVSIWDGQTIVLGGLIREDVQKTEDKVPGLGDIPLIGRLFRTQAENHIKRDLVVFVTANLLNPAGEPIQNTEEKEEVVPPLTGPDIPQQPAPPLPESSFVK